MSSTNTTVKTVRFEINFVEKTICGTKASFKKASRGSGDEYEELVEKMNAHPDFQCVEKEPKHRSNKVKTTYHNMTFAFIEDYITYVSRVDDMMVKYENVKTFAKDNKMSVYPFVKRWFLGEFSINGVFDMSDAEEKIAEAKVAKASNIIPLNPEENNDDASATSMAS